MKVKIGFVFWFVCFWLPRLAAQNTTSVSNQMDLNQFVFSSDSAFISDSLTGLNQPVFYKKHFGLIDSLGNDSMRRTIIKPYQFITGIYTQKQELRRNIPTIKEIKWRKEGNSPWKFWVILFVIAYISFVRIANPKNFRMFMLSVFDLKLSDKIWEDQRSFFGFIILQLFAIYLFIAAIFINNQLEVRQVLWVKNYFWQFLLIFFVLLLVYLFKFILHTLLGFLLKMKKLGIGFVSNTISINNFVALVIFPLIIFTIYYQNDIWSSAIAQSVIAVFFISIIYRIIRIALLSNRFFSFPIIYLFIYLCALEILPWFIIIKFLNDTQI